MRFVRNLNIPDEAQSNESNLSAIEAEVSFYSNDTKVEFEDSMRAL
jgi:hypothetical protein